ncbi:MAG: preprotein translocase subunit TatC [Cyanobacteria bacterium RYN_339]|nr:preprotein translocase subunit TatC [Cyanobacteria bacterium RYN_339]
MSVIEHLEELRWRIIKSLSALTVGTIGVFAVNQPIIHILERPLDATKNLFQAGTAAPVQLIFTSPAEYFVAVCKVAILGGLYLSLPVILYQALAFVTPGLNAKERRWAVPTVIGSFVFFTVGATFAYFLLLPTGLQFLVGFAPPDIKALLSIGKYLGFAAGLVFATGLAFELPLVMLGAAAIGVVTSYQLGKFRRQAFFAAFVLAAVITPSIDMFTQGLMAAALYGLFEFSILLIRLIGR